MKIKYTWHNDYVNPNYWNHRTPLALGMPKPINFYFNLNDNKLRKFLRMQKGRILDMGCGDGRFLTYAHVGVDFSLGMLKRAKTNVANKSLVRASILCLPFKDKSFDVAFMVDVFLHIKPIKRQEAFLEAKRVSEKVYNFLGEHRTVFPFIRQFLEESSFRPKKLIVFVAFLLCFFKDRTKNLL